MNTRKDLPPPIDAGPEQAIQELKDLKERLSTVTRHSFRTPLTVIDGTARRLGRHAGKISPEEVRQRTETIRLTVDKMVELVEHTIELTQLAGCVREEPSTRLALTNVISQIVEEHEFENPNTNVVAWMNECPDLLVTDRRLIELILDKLIGLGISLVTDRGRLDLISWMEGEFAILSLKAIFEARALVDVRELSSRLEADAGSRATGLESGLNLKLIRLLLEQHGGELDIENGEDRIEFEIRLPIADSSSSSGGPLVRPEYFSDPSPVKGVRK